jgi:phage terminase Nu1 subunit (DNA packaging protein)
MTKRPPKTAASAGRTVDAQALAAWLNLSKSRVYQLVSQGMPRKLRGRFEIEECSRWYIRFLQAALEKRAIPTDDGFISEQKERVRKMRADADLKELDLAKQRGELVAIADVEREMTDLVLTTKARLHSLPARLAPDLVGENSRVMVQAKLEKAIDAALRELAERAKEPPSKPSRNG